jgi:hypothetical protein
MTKWISVKDRLPDNGQIVLIKGQFSNPEVSRFIIDRNDMIGRDEYFFMESNRHHQYLGVKHWSELNIPED